MSYTIRLEGPPTRTPPALPDTGGLVDVRLRADGCGAELRCSDRTWRAREAALRTVDDLVVATGWIARDPQRGDLSLASFDHPWRAAAIPGAQQLGSIVVGAPGTLAIDTAPYVGVAQHWTWTLATGALAATAATDPQRDYGQASVAWPDGRVATASGKGCLVEDKRGKRLARLSPPGVPRVWDNNSGERLPAAKESRRSARHLVAPSATRLVAGFTDGRLVVFDVAPKVKQPALASIALLGGRAWVAVAADGTWDGSANAPPAIQWAWVTDERDYRDLHELDPARRRPGLLTTLGL